MLQNQLCSHSVAVAENIGVISIYLDWVHRSESDSNLYNLSTKNVNVRAARQKGGKVKNQENPEVQSNFHNNQ